MPQNELVRKNKFSRFDGDVNSDGETNISDISDITAVINIIAGYKQE